VAFHCGARETETDVTLTEAPTPREVAAACQYLLDEVDGRVELLPDGEPERLVLALGASRFELVRNPEVEIQLGASRALLRVLTEPPGRFHPERESLRGFLDHVFRSAREPDRGGGRLIVVNAAPGGERSVRRFAFAPVGQAVAKRYLAALTEELVSRVHDYLLPCERVFHLKQSRPSLDELDLRATSSARGPVAHPEDFSPPPEEEARALRERRFGLYFGSLVREEAS
jgi:hypothetical protein